MINRDEQRIKINQLCDQLEAALYEYGTINDIDVHIIDRTCMGDMRTKYTYVIRMSERSEDIIR